MLLPASSQPRPERVGEREIHVVTAEQNVFSDADALDLKVAALFPRPRSG